MLLTPKQVAEKLAVSTRTVYLWLEEGRLPAVRLSERVTRVPSQAVDALVARRNPPRSGDPRDLAFLQSHRDEIIAIAARHRASRPRVFGSVARGEAGRASDVDMLFDFDARGIAVRYREPGAGALGAFRGRLRRRPG